MKKLALFLIKFYQKSLSPHKGFSCAYRVHTGRGSCSALGYRAIRLFGVGCGLRILRKRLTKCGIAHRRYGHYPKVLHHQAGFCDVPCDIPCDLPCDAPSCDFHDCHTGDICDLLSNCSSVPSCDCGDWRSKKSKTQDMFVHIPPKRLRY